MDMISKKHLVLNLFTFTYLLQKCETIRTQFNINSKTIPELVLNSENETELVLQFCHETG